MSQPFRKVSSTAIVRAIYRTGLAKQSADIPRQTEFVKHAIGGRAMRIAKMYDAARRSAGSASLSREAILDRAKQIAKTRAVKRKGLAPEEHEMLAGIERHISPIKRTDLPAKANPSYVDLPSTQKRMEVAEDRLVGGLDVSSGLPSWFPKGDPGLDVAASVRVRLLRKVDDLRRKYKPTPAAAAASKAEQDKYMSRIDEITQAIANADSSVIRGYPALSVNTPNPRYRATYVRGLFGDRTGRATRTPDGRPIGKALFYSPQQQVAERYMASNKHVMTTTDEATIRGFGPLSRPTPRFSQDTRFWSPQQYAQENAAAAARVQAGQNILDNLPNFEQVGTMPSRRQWIKSHNFYAPQNGNWTDVTRHYREP